jgi:hypothetical protein
MRSTAEVLDHHLKCFAGRDLDGVLADYSGGRGVFWPRRRKLRRPNAIQPVFERMFTEFAKPGASAARKQRIINGGIGHDLPQEAPQEFAKAVVDVDGY